MIYNINNFDNLNNIIKSNELVIIYFTAKWCCPCKTITPIYERLSLINENKKFLKIDIDDNEDIATKFDIKSIPSFLFFKNGKIIDILKGADKISLEKKINNLI